MHRTLINAAVMTQAVPELSLTLTKLVTAGINVTMDVIFINGDLKQIPVKYYSMKRLK